MNLLEEIEYIYERLKRLVSNPYASIVAMLEVREAARIIDKLGLSAYTWGNISMRVDKNIVITPSGVVKAELGLRDLVVMDMGGDVVFALHTPSSEYPMHLAIYHARDDVKAIIHTHSPYAIGFSLGGVEIPTELSEARMFVGERIPVVRYHPPGSMELGEAVAEILRVANAALLERHGVVAVAETMGRALSIALSVEDAARASLFSGLLRREKLN